MKNSNLITARLLLAGISIVFCCTLLHAQSPLKTRNIAEQWVSLLNAHDSAGLPFLYADTAKLRSPNWEGAKSGMAEIKTIYSRYFSSTPDLQHRIDRITCNDSSVTVEYHFYGTLSNPEAGGPSYMKGKSYYLNACTVMIIRKGKITSQQTYFDQVAFLRQVGFFDQQ